MHKALIQLTNSLIKDWLEQKNIKNVASIVVYLMNRHTTAVYINDQLIAHQESDYSWVEDLRNYIDMPEFEYTSTVLE